jgi:hypothetical protein
MVGTPVGRFELAWVAGCAWRSFCLRGPNYELVLADERTADLSVGFVCVGLWRQ